MKIFCFVVQLIWRRWTKTSPTPLRKNIDDMNIIKIWIPGKPVPKARPRLSKYGIYTPKSTTDYEIWVANHVHKAIIERYEQKNFPLYCGVKLVIIFYFQVKKKEDKEFVCEDFPHIVRPDIDNLEKSIMDGLNRGILKDDCQVHEVHKKKRFTIREPGVLLEIHY